MDDHVGLGSPPTFLQVDADNVVRGASQSPEVVASHAVVTARRERVARKNHESHSDMLVSRTTRRINSDRGRMPRRDLTVQAKIPVTVVVPTLNEATNLALCLERLKGFAEVIVLDSGSTDGTIQIAKAHDANVIDFRWDGRFPKKRNWYLRNFTPRCEWVLFLDADERVDDAFCSELATVLPGTPHAGFEIRYRNWFLGVPLRHGEFNLKLALFRFGSGEYERTEDDHWSGLDMEVHEAPVLRGTIGRIRSVVEHRDYRGLEHWIKKHNQYSTWEARRLPDMRVRAAARPTHLTARQRSKYVHLGKWWLPTAYFLATYVGKLGFLDGWAGFAFALNKAIYFWQAGLKEREFRDFPGNRAPCASRSDSPPGDACIPPR